VENDIYFESKVMVMGEFIEINISKLQLIGV